VSRNHCYEWNITQKLSSHRFFFSYAPASRSRVNVPSRFFINIVPIDEGRTCSRVTAEVRASAKIFELQNHFCWVLQEEMFIGPNFTFPLEILPMQTMPTLDELKKQDLTALCTMTQQQNNLPSNTVSNFFSAQGLDKTHFLVWLPPQDCEFFGQVYPIPA
jgi:hypothetical protein